MDVEERKDTVRRQAIWKIQRHLTKDKHTGWEAIVLGGAYQHKGMLSYKDALSAEDSEAIQAYVIDRAWEAYRAASN